ncbi:MAG: thymidine phosphorylase [Chloroflexota bacterium]
MRAVDIIVKKRDGGELTTAEIDMLIDGYTHDRVSDEQMAAWAMAVVLRGMSDRETADLTLAMARSGAQLDLHDVAPITVDKHSTGGIGDKTTLLLAPLVAAVGLPVAKMSGRALGFSGGTIDKLESIDGFHVEMSSDAFRSAVRDIGLVIAAQSIDLAPADKRLYALRDMTGTVESIPLIAASVMSKKLAAGADCIVLDVKCGRGAFMQTLDEARLLAQTMVAIGRHAGRQVSAVISTMEQPLGQAVGNALEVREAIEALRGHGSDDLIDLCLTLGAELTVLAGKAADRAEGRDLLYAALEDGSAWNIFCRFITNQGGDQRVLDDVSTLPSAPVVLAIPAPRSGVVAAIDGMVLGQTVNALGGGRLQKGNTIDPSVGLMVEAKIGSHVETGQPLVFIHAASMQDAEREKIAIQSAFVIGDQKVAAPPLIHEIVA